MELPGPRQLRRLLDHLVQGPDRTVLLDGVAGLLEAEPSSEVVPPTIRASIERSRRIVYRGQGYRETGLFETRLGLIFLENQHYQLAGEQFAAAVVQWQLADDGYLVALAELATGLAHHHAFDYEAALDHYQRVHDWLTELQTEALPPRWQGRQGERDQFLERLASALAIASEGLQAGIRRLSGQRSVSVQEAEAPIIDAALSKPRLTSSAHGSALLRIDTSGPLSIAHFEESVLAALKAVEQIDSALALLYDWPGIGLTITRLQLTDGVTVEIRGQSPVTLPFLKRLLSEASLSALSDGSQERASLRSERDVRTGGGTARAATDPAIDTARRLVRQNAPGDVTEERIEATAWRMLAALHDLAELRYREIGVTIEGYEDKG